MVSVDSEIVLTDPSDTILFDLTEKFGHDAPLKRILQIVLAQGCKSIVVEVHYDEEEWTQERDIFYGKVFKKYPEKCDRLHFFASNLEKKDLNNLTKFKDNYLGFCVLRPLPEQRVVNAIIKPFKDENDPPKSFVLCQEVFPVEILMQDGTSQILEISGFPFMQQDGQAGCCAHAALIMADRFLVQRRNKGKAEDEKKEEPHFLQKIRKFLSLVPGEGRKIPTSGLRPVDISEALEKMGYSALVYEYKKDSHPPFPAEKVIYHYLESRIPVQLIIPTKGARHVLTIIGHSFDPDVWWALAREPYYQRRRSESEGNYHCSTNWIEHFIIQDDNFGPYLTVPKDYVWECETTGQLVVAVPLPPDVNMEGESAESFANYCIASEIDLNGIINASNSGKINDKTFRLFRIMWEHYIRKDLVLRTCLLDTREFIDRYIAEHLKSYYQNVRLYNKIWVTEISIPELFCHNRKRLGEIVIDPTAPPNSLPLPYLAIHVPGVFKTRDVDTDQPTTHYLPDDGAYGHIIR
jgi:hypothetical protein